MSVIAVHGLEQFHNIINQSEYTIFDFWASWCGPCRFISPIFEKLVTQYPTVKFYKVDTDAEEDISAALNIRALPTFILFKNGRKIAEVVGAAPQQLQQLLQAAAKN